MSKSYIPSAPVIIDNTALIADIVSQINTNTNAKATATQNIVIADNDVTQEQLTTLTTVNGQIDTNVQAINQNTNDSLDTKLPLALLDVAKTTDLSVNRWIENFGNGHVNCRMATGAIRSYAQSTFRSEANQQGSSIYVYNANWRTVADITSKRGSYHGWLTAYVGGNATFNVKVTIDGEVFEEKTYTTTGAGNLIRMCNPSPVSDNTVKDSTSTFVIGHSHDAHVNGLGEAFSDSLKIEIQSLNYWTGNPVLEYAHAFYYAEDKL